MKLIRQYIQEVDIQAHIDVDDEWVANFIKEYVNGHGVEPSLDEIYTNAIYTHTTEEIDFREPADERAVETWVEE